MRVAAFVFLITVSTVAVSADEDARVKRSFVQLGCMGAYDNAKLTLLNSVCQECQKLFSEPDTYAICRTNCFKNSFFTKCMDALLMGEDKPLLDSMAGDLRGEA